MSQYYYRPGPDATEGRRRSALTYRRGGLLHRRHLLQLLLLLLRLLLNLIETLLDGGRLLLRLLRNHLLGSVAGPGGVLGYVVDELPLVVSGAVAVNLDSFALDFAGHAGNAAADCLSRDGRWRGAGGGRSG